jgi:hypothetical protein
MTVLLVNCSFTIKSDSIVHERTLEDPEIFLACSKHIEENKPV